MLSKKGRKSVERKLLVLMRGLILSMMLLVGATDLSVGQIASESLEKSKLQKGTIVLKLKEISANGFLRQADSPSALERLSEKSEVHSFNSLFPKTSLLRSGSSKSGLERIYFVDIDKDANPEDLINELSAWSDVEYAEPLFENELLYIPNDPMANPNSGSQYHLTNIKAYEAWNIEKGDSNVVVGIIDTGADLDHEDLLPNMALNHDDPINGVDDDMDGYVDNYYGWDLSDNDALPNTDLNKHGDVVSGVSNAKTGNGLGVAGTGFQTRFLPVKIYHNATGKLRDEYFGILYAVNQGCKVINLSWGSPNSYSQFGQDIIDYAVLDNDVVVVAAAGNTHAELDFYPASYENVLSVASSGPTDAFSSWATYSYKIDLMAPGENIISTTSENQFGNGGNGTSFASPMVAGAAALVRSKYPELDARQVMELIRVSTDDVSDIGNNSLFKGKIGSGRLNIEKALTNISTPAVRLEEFTYSSPFDDYIFPGDTITISTKFINYLSETSNLKISIKAIDDKIVSNEKVYQVGSLDTYEILDKSDDTWKVVIADHVEPYSRVIFQITYEDEGYRDYEFFEFQTAPWYLDVENNDLLLTVASDGDLAYDQDYFTYGNGFRYQYERIAHNLGIIISKDENYVADNLLNDFSSLTKEKDFKEESYVRLFNNSDADIDARSSFKESVKVTKQGIKVEQKVLGWSDDPQNDFFIVEYRVVNESDSTLNGLNVSFFSDWDLENRYFNAAAYNSSEGLLYTYDKINNNLFAGVSILTSGDSVHSSIDLENYNGNTAEFGAEFTDLLKHEYASGIRGKLTAGSVGNGNNVANLAGLKNISLAAGQSKKIAFALIAANSLQDLIDELAIARSKYTNYVNNPPLAYIANACFGDEKEIFPLNASELEVFSDPHLVNSLGSGSSFISGPLDKDTTYYVTEINNGIREDVKSVQVKIRAPKADFASGNDTLLISGGEENIIQFINQSSDAYSYSWDFDNGFFSTVKDPKIKYNYDGKYEIKLKINNDIGCSDSTIKELTVISRGPRPIVENQTICAGNATEISSSSTNSIRIYGDNKLTNLLFEGAVYQTEVLSATKEYFVTNNEDVESLPVKVTVSVSQPETDFAYELTYSEEIQSPELVLINTSSNATSHTWMVNNESFSGQDTIRYDYSGAEEIAVMLAASDSLSCELEKNEIFTPELSDIPAEGSYEICRETPFELTPDNGEYFLLYADAKSTTPVDFGRSFTIGPFERDTTVYISNVDKLIESEKAAIQITLNSFEARADARPDSINLAEANEVVISNLTVGATDSYWLSPTGIVDTSQTFTQYISNPGTYQYTLVAKGGGNCVDTAKVDIFAYLLTAIEPMTMAFEESKFSVYPNPARDKVNLTFKDGENDFNKLELIDASGKVFVSEEMSSLYSGALEINTSHLTNGIYLLRLYGNSEIRSQKIIIAH